MLLQIEEVQHQPIMIHAYLAKFLDMTHLNLSYGGFKARVEIYRFFVRLYFWKSYANCGCISWLSGFSDSQILQLQGEWMSHLQGLAKLESLHLAGSREIAEEHFRCSTQEALHLCQYQVIFAWCLMRPLCYCSYWKPLPSLRSVPLYRCLADLPRLAALDLSHSVNVTDGVLHTLANISGLTWLGLNGCSKIKNGAFSCL
jgi:hypothetical protein